MSRSIPFIVQTTLCVVQDKFADIGSVFDGADLGGQWLSEHLQLLRGEFDTDQEEQELGVVGGG